MTKEELFAKVSGNWPSEDLDTPELGTVRVRAMTARERDEVEAIVTNGNMDNMSALIACRVLANGDNTRIFADDDAVVLGEKMPARSLRMIARAGGKLSGIKFTEDDAEKNSETSPN